MNDQSVIGWLESMQRQDILVRWLVEDTGLDDAVIRALLPVAYRQAAKQNWDVAVLWQDGYGQLNLACWDSDTERMKYAITSTCKCAQVFRLNPEKHLIH